MDPVEFIRQSRFRHHRGWESDQGYNHKEKRWVTSNSKAADYYDPPVDYLNLFSPWKNGENRRPRDDNNGDHWNVFLQPEGRPKGSFEPTGEVPVFYYQRSVDTSQIPAKLRKQYGIKIQKYVRISFWWFMGFNDAPLKFDHQGDWEHVTVRIEAGAIVGVWFAAHDGPAQYHEKNTLKWSNGRVVVYCAKGTHASYRKPGEYSLPFGFKDIAAAGGYEWDVSQKLANLYKQPWRNYAGAWGEVGEFAFSTGPLGPWHKRHKA